MGYEIVVHEECEPWLLTLQQDDFDRIAAAIDQLSEHGPGLGRPRVDTIKGSRHKYMKELRAGSMRVVFAFDPDRAAILLLGGDKAGRWQDWYIAHIPIADNRYDNYLAETSSRSAGDRAGRTR